MHCGLDFAGVGVWGEGEEGAEGEVLDDGEFGEDFCVVHFDHALILLLISFVCFLVASVGSGNIICVCVCVFEG